MQPAFTSNFHHSEIDGLAFPLLFSVLRHRARLAGIVLLSELQSQAFFVTVQTDGFKCVADGRKTTKG